MANPIRGEIDAVIGGETRMLCLTLGALAELEARLQAGDLVGLAERFSSGRVSARDLTAILGAGLRGRRQCHQRRRSGAADASRAG